MTVGPTVDQAGDTTSGGMTSAERTIARGGKAASPLLEVDDLVKHFEIRGGLMGISKLGAVRAVDGVSFKVREGETLGLVGESGCGKTTLGKVILRLIPPTSGTVTFEGKQLFGLNPRQLKAARRDIQVVFQDPYASLNPRMSVGEIVGEGLYVHGMTNKRERESAVRDLLKRVGLNQQHIHRYPHEFSGGQRQRIGIARALAVEPDLIVCDEPVSALDVSVQAQIINLLMDLQQQRGIAYLFIAHDLAVVEHISRRVMVMYLGNVVETAEAKELVRSPRHPYTEALLSAVPVVDPASKRQRIVLPGDVPSPINPPPGCNFHPRCPKALDICKVEMAPLREVAPGHFVACHVAQNEAGLKSVAGMPTATATAERR